MQACLPTHSLPLWIKYIIMNKLQLKQKQFRIQAKRLFLTYSQIPNDLTKEEVLKQLELKFNIQGYLIAREFHEDNGVHIHALIELRNRCDIRNYRILDLIWEGNRIHGNYQVVKNMNAVRMYLMKGEDFITNWDIEYKTGKLLSLEKKLAIMTTKVGIDRTLKYFITNHMNELDKYARIETNLKRLDKQVQKLRKNKALYDINSFEPQVKIDEALKDLKHSTWVSGPSDTHKTSYVEARIEANRDQDLIKDYIFIRHLDQLKQFNADIHEAIILDDCALPDEREALISLVDTERPGAVNVKYDVITIPANVKRIFVSNYSFNEILSKRRLGNDKAIIRRVKEIRITKKIALKENQVILTYQ